MYSPFWLWLNGLFVGMAAMNVIRLYFPPKTSEQEDRLDAEGQTVEGGDLSADILRVKRRAIMCMMDGMHVDGNTLSRWLDAASTLEHQAAELTRLKAAQPEHDRTVRLAITDEMALQGAWGPINEFAQRLGLQPFEPRMAPDINEIERVRLILSAALNMATNGTPKEKAGS